MDEQAYADLQEIEQTHWWYRGVRAVCHMLLKRYARTIQTDLGGPELEGSALSQPVLEVGCGSGGNLALLGRWGPVVGLDPWHPALSVCPPLAAALVQGTGGDLPFADETFRLVALLNVLEHVEDDVAVLSEAGRVCRSEGTMLLVVPAFMFLWSGHDQANHHWRRYTAGEVRHKAARAGLTIRYLSYQNCFLFPLVVAVRLLQRLAPPGPARIDMFPLPEPGSTLLTWLLLVEGWLMHWIALPVGASLVAVLER